MLGPMSLFLTLTLLPWHSMAAPRWQVLLFLCTASPALVPLSLCSNEGLCWLMLASHSEDQLFRPPLHAFADNDGLRRGSWLTT